jgi:chloramphenicol O-acetyltransferase
MRRGDKKKGSTKRLEPETVTYPKTDHHVSFSSLPFFSSNTAVHHYIKKKKRRKEPLIAVINI